MKYNGMPCWCSTVPLWFAFKIVPLVYEIQLWGNYRFKTACCDLLSKSYLWYMKYNGWLMPLRPPVVVICFQNRTFGIWNTTNIFYLTSELELWFAFKIVPLVYEIQPTTHLIRLCFGCDLLSKSYLWYMKYNLDRLLKADPDSCDLLSKSYLWYMKYNKVWKAIVYSFVVICFQNRTFGIWNTT